MVWIRIPRGWEIPERDATPEHVYRSFNRRSFLQAAGAAAAGAILNAAVGPEAGAAVARNPKFALDRPLTDEAVANRYNNFYEFSMQKDVYRYTGSYQPKPWTLEITGQVRKPLRLDLDDLLKKMPVEERLYRHRCVEAWAMAVPWTGFQFSELIKLAEPTAKAKYVRFLSLYRPNQMPGQTQYTWYPWPYFEGLRLDEAMNELTFAVTGMYGHDMAKQHGAPLRLAVPWKYGYKSAKAIVKIEFVERQPATFWETLQPLEYPFESNVNPKVPHPRWSQAVERMLGTDERRPTILYNGYGEWVAHLYAKK